MIDILFETIGAIFAGVILWVLTYHMVIKNALSQAGSKFILIGFGFFFFGMLIDITDNFPELNHLVVIGDTEVQAFLEKVVGTLSGLLLLSIGFYRWLPNISSLEVTQAKLKKLNEELDNRVQKRTIELENTNERLTEEIQKREKTEDKLRRQALFDGLTNLPNRTLSLDRLSQLISEAQRKNEKVAVLFLDLDDFKKVNDTLGHEAGDHLLVEAADRLSTKVRTGDTIGRLGGDEFIVLLGGLSDSPDVSPIAESLLNQFRKAFIIDGRELMLTVSIGVSIFPDDGDCTSSLLRNADSAMYHSKELGRNIYSYFTDEMNNKVSRRLALEEQMHGALERGEFSVFYQPKVDINSNKIIGSEALLRWINPALGNVSPVEFIPIAEQTGFIQSLGQFVLTEAMSATVKWQKKFNSDLVVFINISPIQFRDPMFVDQVGKVINTFCSSGNCLELEITEGVLMSEHGYIYDALNALNNLGVGIAMDDFGTGYSSLSYLRQYPFDVLKIDRSFVHDITTNPADLALIKATIVMAHALGLKVIAEGVETKKQLVHLDELGCDYAQGYLISKPVPADEMGKLIELSINKGSLSLGHSAEVSGDTFDSLERADAAMQ